MLARGSIVVSTAKQENFGMSIVEAIRFGCIPVLPNRLAYPEIIPKIFHNDFLYTDHADCIEKLAGIISERASFDQHRMDLSISMERFAWENIIASYDKKLELLAGMS